MASTIPFVALSEPSHIGRGDFMKSFYSTSNLSLSAYMGEEDGCFAPDTVMARSEVELKAALDAGYMDAKTDAHTACMDICTIIKVCVFEWCLLKIVN